MSSKTENDKSKRKNLPGWFVLLVLSSLATFIWYQIPESSHPPINQVETKKSPVIDEYNALITCQNRVRNNMRSPSSAKFPPMRDINVYKVDENEWLIRGFVDGQNSFGAVVREHYECQVEYTGQLLIIHNFKFIK
ncbi:hypothetical protein [Nitrincola schmidtii]|uniref:hypothetical protein n=1 Tax=Nitrincola schmidtii TaxID=1730894 RepID=UPI00124C7317|nr:hypothetical protein [Nitrincola schmidtii]